MGLLDVTDWKDESPMTIRLQAIACICLFSAFALVSGCGSGQAAAVAAPPAAIPTPVPAPQPPAAHYVFTQTNDAAANRVLVLRLAGDGSLSQVAEAVTGGKGNGSSLQNQGSLALNEDASLLFVVNAGSNDFSVFQVHGATLSLASRTASGGLVPISISEARGIVYVLNDGSRALAADNISGFRVDAKGAVTPLADASRALSADATSAAQLSLNADATFALVTERGTAKLDLFAIDGNGSAAEAAVSNSSGTIPFGFQFLDASHVFISEEGTNGVSSYSIAGSKMTAITRSEPNHQSGTCWLAITPSGKFLYTTNTSARTISAYAIAANGTTTLIGSTGVAAVASGPPIDAAISPDGKFLFVVDSGEGVDSFGIGVDGGLSLTGNLAGVGTTLNGIVAD